MQLARELNVSQGTVRNALTESVETNVLVRRQGKGTFVASHDDKRALFHFFHRASSDGTKILPECETLGCRNKRASKQEAAALNVAIGAKVISIQRIRKLDDLPVIFETISLASELFGDLLEKPTFELPNTLYELYETQLGNTIHRAEEQLRASSASAREASLLGIDAGAPLLEIERTAFALDGTPVELRISHCKTSNHYYQSTVF